MSLPILKGTEPLVGWKGWALYEPGYLVTNNMVWLPGERAEAVCNRHTNPALAEEPHVIPQEGCTCGIYSFNDPALVHENGYSSHEILGEIWLWGRVIECSQGFRAEYAYPKKFYVTMYRRAPNMSPFAPLTEKRKQFIEYMAYRYKVPLEWIKEGHPLVTEDPVKKAAREKALAERTRQIALERKIESQKSKKLLEARAKALPATKPGFSNLLEQIEAEADEVVRKKSAGTGV